MHLERNGGGDFGQHFFAAKLLWVQASCNGGTDALEMIEELRSLHFKSSLV